VLKNKNIILGVTGSIAAYKAAILIRLLVKEGAHVKVIMTDLAKAFITPLTLATLTKNPVLVDFYNPENGDWNNHVDLGLWADAYLIAPVTANTMAKMAHGIADNLLLTTYLSARCPVFIAPAMDMDMLRHRATQENIKMLKSRGHVVIEPSSGELASGLEGKGRMEEPVRILDVLKDHFQKDQGEKKKTLNRFQGKKVLLTAGPTYEAIDPVRFIGNHSTGKMGYALAEAFIREGARVHLVSGPTGLFVPEGLQSFIRVQQAEEMHQACQKLFPQCDIVCLTAAVADYKPVDVKKQKIKAQSSQLTIELEKTIDIAAELGKQKNNNQFVVGFALETDNELKNAGEKLKKKNFDLIVLNSLRDRGAGFGYDTNKVTLIDSDNKTYNFGLKQKEHVARDILDVIDEKLQKYEAK
jgi:phosphopantothenoylcysteine decarboxylase/phosphopantothenate--cysteine ligase